MSTEYALERSDKLPIGSFDDVQSIIRAILPTVTFGWTKSGADKLRIANERGIELPAPIREVLETLPSLLEGQAEVEGSCVTFGLGYDEPVKCLYVTPHGSSSLIELAMAELEVQIDGKFVVSGEETNRLANLGR